jgi:hypothetical protein
VEKIPLYREPASLAPLLYQLRSLWHHSPATSRHGDPSEFSVAGTMRRTKKAAGVIRYSLQAAKNEAIVSCQDNRMESREITVHSFGTQNALARLE